MFVYAIVQVLEGTTQIRFCINYINAVPALVSQRKTRAAEIEETPEPFSTPCAASDGDVKAIRPTFSGQDDTDIINTTEHAAIPANEIAVNEPVSPNGQAGGNPIKPRHKRRGKYRKEQEAQAEEGNRKPQWNDSSPSRSRRSRSPENRATRPCTASVPLP